MSGVIMHNTVKQAWPTVLREKKINMEEKEETSSVVQTFTILRMILRVSGLYNEWRVKREQASWKTTVLKTVYIILCFSLNLLLLLNIFRLYYVVTEERAKGISTTLMAAYAIVLHKMCGLYDSLTTLFSLSPKFESMVTDLKIYEEQYTAFRGKPNLPVVVRRVSILYVFAAMTVCGGFGVIMYCTFDLSITFKDILLSFGDMPIMPIELAISLVCFVEIIHVNQQFAETLALIVTVYILRRHFSCITQQVRQMGDKHEISDDVHGLVSSTRRKFEFLHAIVLKLDDCFNHFVAITFPNGMGVICLTLYGLFVDNLSYVDAAAIILFILKSGMQLATITIGGIVLNNKIHEPLNYLHALDFRQLPGPAIQEVSVFITRLSGCPIGLTVYGLFVIDKSTILMLIGTILTYAIVILQLKPDDSTAAVRDLLLSSNCTSI